MNKINDYNFSDTHFEILRKLLYQHTGISLAESKRQLVYSRVARRLRALELDNFDAYCKLLKTGSGQEFDNFINAMTTNKTEFFRENHHFEFLTHTAIPYLMQARKQERRIRIWSAGCSTGQEPYSIAMVLQESIPQIAQWDVKILATDLDFNVVATAEEGSYKEEVIAGISSARLKKWFRKGRDKNSGIVKVSPDLQKLITFKQLNLMDKWPMRGRFDLLFCRNVVIYFDKNTQRKLFDRYANILTEDGHLFVGHSESLFNVSDRYEHLGSTIHKKVA